MKKPQKRKKKPLMRVSTPQLSLSNALLAAIGDVISMWSIFENTACYVTGAAFGQTDLKTTRLLFVQMDWLGKVELLKLLCRRHDAKDALTALEHIEKQSDPLRQTRNRLSHGVWSRRKTGRKALHVVQFRGSFDGYDMRIWPRTFFPKTKALRKTAQDIRDLIAHIEGWYEKYMRDISPSAVPLPGS